MKILAVDDEPKALSSFLRVLREAQPTAEIASFTDSQDAFTYLASNKVDVAFLDINMGRFNGITLAQKCKSLCPAVNVIFVTGYSQYAMEALQLHASGYLMKPVRIEDLHRELDNLRHPLLQQKSRVQIQAFGNFEVFVDEKALRVPRRKCKECLAYLVDRKGAGVTYAQLSSVLWEYQPIERAVQMNTQKIVSELGKALREVNAEDILVRTRMDIAIDVKKVDCDYFEAINGDLVGLSLFNGEYMSNYSWAEYTLGELIRMRDRR